VVAQMSDLWAKEPPEWNPASMPVNRLLLIAAFSLWAELAIYLALRSYWLSR
jgi:hypothetical protein